MNVEKRQVAGDAGFELDGQEQPAHPRHGRAEDLVRVDPVALERQPARAEPGHVEQILDIAIEPLALAADGFQELRAGRSPASRSP